jgi:hypothetical protein
MSVISTSIDNSNQAITCCVCLDTTPSNTNFRSWNCTGEHSDTICNKCHSHMMEHGNNCPICRATHVQVQHNIIVHNPPFGRDRFIVTFRLLG